MGSVRKRSTPSYRRDVTLKIQNEDKGVDQMIVNDTPLYKQPNLNNTDKDANTLFKLKDYTSIDTNYDFFASNPCIYVGKVPLENDKNYLDYANKNSKPMFLNIEEKFKFEILRDFLHLNINFLKFVKEYCHNNEIYDLSPALQDYITHANNIRQRCDTTINDVNTTFDMHSNNEFSRLNTIKSGNDMKSDSLPHTPFQSLYNKNDNADKPVSTINNSLSGTHLMNASDLLLKNNPLLKNPSKNCSAEQDTLPSLSSDIVSTNETCQMDNNNLNLSPQKKNATTFGLHDDSIFKNSELKYDRNKNLLNDPSLKTFTFSESANTRPLVVSNTSLLSKNAFEKDTFSQSSNTNVKSDALQKDKLTVSTLNDITSVSQSTHLLEKAMPFSQSSTNTLTTANSHFMGDATVPYNTNVASSSIINANLNSNNNDNNINVTNLYSDTISSNDSKLKTTMSAFKIPSSSLFNNPLLPNLPQAIKSPFSNTGSLTNTEESSKINGNSISKATSDPSTLLDNTPKPFGSNLPFNFGASNPLSLLNTNLNSNTAPLSGLSNISSSSFKWQPATLNEQKCDVDNTTHQNDGDDVTLQEQQEQAIQQEAKAIEPNAYYHQMCRLYFKKGDSWKLIGCGVVNLIESQNSDNTTKQLILIVRQSPSSNARVLLNIRLNKALDSNNLIGSVGICFMSFANPPIADETNDKPVMFLLKFREKEACTEFQNKFNQIFNV